MNTIETQADLIRETLSSDELYKLGESGEYADFLMENADFPINNGFMLTEAMEAGKLFDEFLINKFN